MNDEKSPDCFYDYFCRNKYGLWDFVIFFDVKMWGKWGRSTF